MLDMRAAIAYVKHTLHMGLGMGYLKTAPKRYFFEVMTASVLYLIAMRLRFLALHAITNPVLLFGAKLLPLLAILLIGLAVWRLYNARDELQRQVMLKIGATSLLLSILAFMALPSFYMLGLPIPAPRTPLGLIVLIACLFPCALFFAFQRYRQESGFWRALVRMTPIVVTMIVIPAAYWLTISVLPVPPIPFWRGLVWLAIGGGIWFAMYQMFFRHNEQ
jgi:hypothetical protein